MNLLKISSLFLTQVVLFLGLILQMTLYYKGAPLLIGIRNCIVRTRLISMKFLLIVQSLNVIIIYAIVIAGVVLMFIQFTIITIPLQAIPLQNRHLKEVASLSTLEKSKGPSLGKYRVNPFMISFPNPAYFGTVYQKLKSRI